MNIKNVPFLKLGNKTDDIKNFIDYIPTNCHTIVEPFAGSFAVSRILYDPTKYKIHINDIDPNLFYLLKHMKQYLKIRTKIISYIHKYTPDNKNMKEYILKMKIHQSFKQILQSTFIIRGFVKAPKTNFDYKDLLFFLDNIKITNDNYEKCMSIYSNDENAFLFCDPPYFGSDNTDYSTFGRAVDDDNRIIDNTEMYVYLSKYIKDCKCKIMIIINDNAILRHLFTGYVKCTYQKTYQLSKKKDTLMIITNY